MYPSPDVDPKTKGREWLLKYAEQAWKDGTGVSPHIFYGAAPKYNELKLYALGKQDVSRYKKPYVDEQGETFATGLDYTVRPVISKYRDIAISKLQQRQYNIVATPIDAIAKSDADSYFADIRAKILMRDMLKQINPEALESPQVKQLPGEPEDMEELDMQKDYTWKHNMAMEAEMVWSLITDMNGFPEERSKTITNMYDFGVGGYKEWNDANNATKLRAVDPRNVICGWCRRPDFTDATHMGEVIEVNLSYLQTIFSDEELKSLNNLKQYAYRPSSNTSTTDKSKVQVLDLELITTDDIIFSQRETTSGNVVYGREDYKKYDPKKKVVIKGREEPKYTNKRVENVYKCKWVIGTTLLYDFGLATNQKREKSNPSKAALSYHMMAWNFDNMQAVGVMERLRPTLDEYQETVVKIRNFKNKWIAYIIDIDMDALESVSLGNGGQNMKPMELIDMMLQTGILLSRKREAMTGNINYKSVDIIPTAMAQELAVLINELGRLEGEISKISGFNELTDGSTPNAKTLVPVAASAIDATNNSQYPIIRADKSLNERLAKGIVLRVQMAVKSGKPVEGIVRSLGETTVKFFRTSESFPLHEFGIQVEDRPTNEERSLLIQELNLKNAQQQVDPEVFVMIMDAPNLKQARMLLAYYTKKKRKKDQEQAMQVQQQNGQIQIQSAQAAEQAKQQTLQLEYQLKSNLELQLKQIDLQIAQLKVEGASAAQEATAGMKITNQMLDQNHSERQNKIKAGITPTDEPMPVEMMPEQPVEMPTEEVPQEEMMPA